MAYRDITSQSTSVLWGPRAAERNAETRKKLENDGRIKIKKIRKATVGDVYEYFILLQIETKIAGNGFCESLSWKEFEAMR